MGTTAIPVLVTTVVVTRAGAAPVVPAVVVSIAIVGVTVVATLVLRRMVGSLWRRLVEALECLFNRALREPVDHRF